MKLLDWFRGLGYSNEVRAEHNALLAELDARLPEQGTPVNSEFAKSVLTLSDVGFDGETITVGDETYELDTDGITEEGNIVVDISAGAVASQGTLTIAEPVTAEDTMTIGDTLYTFKANGTAADPGDIDLGADEAATKVNIVAAINGTDGINSANTSVSAAEFVADDCVLTALVPGSNGDLIATIEGPGQGLTHASNVFDDVNLGTTTAGADMAVDDQLLAISSAITLNSTSAEASADVDTDTITVSALVAGFVDGLIVTSAETMDNGEFDNESLLGGLDGTVSYEGKIMIDSDNIYVAQQENTRTDAVWKKATLSSL